MRLKKHSRVRIAGIGVLVAASIAAVGGAALAASGPPMQKNVPPQVQAVPGSGKGIVIGYATSLEAVPIVHVISNGITRAGQARGRQARLLRHRRRPRQGARLREDDEDAGRAGHTCSSSTCAKASPAICKAGPRACR